MSHEQMEKCNKLSNMKQWYLEQKQQDDLQISIACLPSFLHFIDAASMQSKVLVDNPFNIDIINNISIISSQQHFNESRKKEEL
jgi:hypothetical protein